jgi:DNA invertase Pin-like site-specific DNA recombinase
VEKHLCWSDGVSTHGATGKLVLHIPASVAQFDRQLLIERTVAGWTAARAEGRPSGRRRAMTPQDIVAARAHMTEGKLKARARSPKCTACQRDRSGETALDPDVEVVRASA